jgi:predicted transcriptional regulator
MDRGNPSESGVASTPAHGGAPPPQADAPSAPPSEGTVDRLTLLQQAYLLEQLASHGAASKPAAELNRKIAKGAERKLQLTAKVANGVRAALAEKGYVQITKAGQTLLCAITEAGRTYLATLERPALPGRTKAAATVDDATMSDEVREAQKAYLLLQLLDADGQPLSKGDANRKRAVHNQLGLKPPVANYRRAKLAERGYIRVVTAGRNEAYSLTPDGLECLAAGARHLAHAEFTLKGKTLNALVTAARESPFQGGQPTAAPLPATPLPDKPALENAVLGEFEELRRERHGRSGLVPIYEVRQRIVDRFGQGAGRHDVLDEIILGLWRQKRLGLEGISDLGKATSEQLNDGIPGVSGTLFYLEAPREQPVAP